jgi:hypothetical protein
MKSIPKDYEDAAMIDGCSYIALLLKNHCAHVEARISQRGYDEVFWIFGGKNYGKRS